MEIVKMTVNMHKVNMDAARELSRKQHKTITDVINHAVSVEKYLSELPPGAQLIVKKPDGTMTEIIFK
jgi:hypothetical protein